MTRPSVSNFNPNSGSAGGTTFSSGQTTLNEYNAFGNLVRIRELVATSPSVYADTYLYYDRLGQNVAQVDQASYLTIFEYDETGDLKRQVEYAQAAHRHAQHDDLWHRRHDDARQFPQ